MAYLNRTTKQWQDIDTAHHLHPFTDYKSLAKEGSNIIVKADGAHLTNTDDKQFLDAMSGLWCVNVGYGRKNLADVAYKQMQELPYYNSFFKTATAPSIELAQQLAEIAPNDLNHAFFSSSGSEANDTVVRMVRRYWDLKGKPNKKTFISREYAYHGSTMTGVSLGGMTAMHAQGGMMPGFDHVMPPYWYKYGADMSPEEFGLFTANKIEEKINEIGPENVAAFIGEPIQGAGGVIIPPDSYWPRVQEICNQYDILLVVDEVICGFGRTGEWFGSNTYNIKPDIITMAKGISSGYIPLSGIMVGDRVTETLIDEGGEFYHGYTYSGHPVACAVAIENLKIIREENLIENSRKTSVYLKERMNEIAEHPLVGEVRMKSFIGAVELVKDKDKRIMFEETGVVGGICRDYCIENGLVMRAVRDGMIFCPPLIFNNNHIDELVEKLKKSLDQTHAHISKS
ncbi:MAG: aspartate aminotransferase family protein [Pelagibacteraceae bacterium]|nr:aspartate aminotransferase family protein [Pelagibacteraceae bacterium]|tara:strand:- start:7068 stop:8435 length:1368 start_codon:yes stop_codon:yes gene_type:complete